MVNAREALTRQVAGGGAWRVAGTGAHATFTCDAGAGLAAGTPLATRDLNRLMDHEGPDHVVVAEAGMTLRELQAHLALAGQCLPYAPLWAGLEDATLGGLIAMNLPSLAEAQHGSWHEWVLGMTLVRADGTVAKSGSRAVKSVAGFDVHHLAIGARGAVGVIVEVILRTATVPGWRAPQPLPVLEFPWIQRVRLGDLERAVAERPEQVCRKVPEMGLVVAEVPPSETRRRWPGDWVIRGGCGEGNFLMDDPVAARLLGRLRAVMDPEGRINPLAFPSGSVVGVGR